MRYALEELGIREIRRGEELFGLDRFLLGILFSVEIQWRRVSLGSGVRNV